MSELDNLTSDVPASSLTNTTVVVEKSIEEINAILNNHFKFDLEEQSKFKEGAVTERMGNSLLLKMVLQSIITIIDESKKVSLDKQNEAMFLQNKKVLKDITFGLFSALNNFEYNDRQHKILLLGKVIQSLHGKY